MRRLWLLAVVLAAPAAAQRPARPDDFLGLTYCENGVATSRLRADTERSPLAEEIEAHEAVHRAQAEAFSGCEAFLASLTSARRIIEVELPAYCAQYHVAVARGAQPDSLRREYAWRIAAQSGAMENRLEILQMFLRQCTEARRRPPP